MYFKDIIGQEEIKKRLIHSAQTGVVPHAQLFTEQGGAGAFPLTLAYARYLNCTNRTETDSCGHCPSCLKYNELAHPDLHFVFPIVSKKDKKKGGNPLFMGFATLIICYLINSLKLFLEAWNLITGNHILVVEEILHET